MRRLSIALFLLSLAAPVQAQQDLTITISWPDMSDNEDGFRVLQCVGQGCTPNQRIWGDQPPNTTTLVDQIGGDPGGRVICYQVEAFNAGGASKNPVQCITTPPVVKAPNAPGPASVSVTVNKPGPQSMMIDPCASGFALKAGSPAIDAGEYIAGHHCPAAGRNVGQWPSGCVEWNGKAPDLGACEFWG